jgi:hypothetical protein
MITEDYVSFETAKLLKERGFDVYGDGSYNSGIEIYKEYSPSGKLNSCATSKPNKKAYPAPTLQMAMKWLREKHKITIGILFKGNRIYYEIHQNNEFVFGIDTPESYAKVCDEAIKYCLKI